MAKQETNHHHQIMLELAFDLEGFLASWQHCDQMANYIGRCLSSGRPDAFSYENILSTIANELLETIYWRNAGQGTVALAFSEQQLETRITASIPVNAASTRFYREILQHLAQRDHCEFYQELLLSAVEEPGVLSLSELVANYGAKLELSAAPDGASMRLDLTMVIQ